jgi:hypothetical protein
MSILPEGLEAGHYRVAWAPCILRLVRGLGAGLPASYSRTAAFSLIASAVSKSTWARAARKAVGVFARASSSLPVRAAVRYFANISRASGERSSSTSRIVYTVNL